MLINKPLLTQLIQYLGYYLSAQSPEFSIPPLPRRWNSSGPLKMTCNYTNYIIKYCRHASRFVVSCVAKPDRWNYKDEDEIWFKFISDEWIKCPIIKCYESLAESRVHTKNIKHISRWNQPVNDKYSVSPIPRGHTYFQKVGHIYCSDKGNIIVEYTQYTVHNIIRMQVNKTELPPYLGTKLQS